MPEFVTFTGPLYIGSMLNWCLFGSFVVQLYDYYTQYQKTDRPSIKALVYFIFLAEVIQLVLMTYTVYDILVTGYGNPSYIVTTPWSSVAAPVLNGIISVSVQLFFAWRIWILEWHSFSRAISIIICIIGMMQVSASVALAIQYSLLDRHPDILGSLRDTVIIWLSGSFACDILIAVTMVTLLIRARSESSFKNTEKMINTLIINTIETGAITAIIALLELALYLHQPDNFVHISMEYVLGRLFSNVLMANLNGRRRLRRMNSEQLSIVISGGDIDAGSHSVQFRSMPSTGARGAAVAIPSETRVTREVHVDHLVSNP